MSAELTAPIPGYIPARSLNLFGGPPHSGKTPFLVQLAVALRDGAPFLGHPTITPPAMGWACLDRPWEETQPWFDKAGLDIPHYSLADDTGFEPEALTKVAPETRKELLSRIKDILQLPPGGVLFVDPCPLIINADGNSYARVAAGMLTLHQFLQRHNLTFIGADHAGKQKEGSGEQYARLQDRIIGSAAKQGYASTTMYLSPPATTPGPHIFEWCPRHSPIETFNLAQDPNTGFFLLEAAVPDTGSPSTPPADAHGTQPSTPGIPPEFEALVQCLPDCPGAAQKEQVRILFVDMSERTFERFLQRAVSAGWVAVPRKGKYQRTAQAKALLNPPS